MTSRLTSARAHRLVRPRADLPRTVTDEVRAVVIGGGIAGVTSALLLAERGIRVTLLERDAQLGGRLAAWPQVVADGSRQMVEHGFHGFFRQYYNLHNVLRRIDPELSFLRPAGRYPVVSRNWPEESFSGLPRRPPANLLALVARSPSLKLRELRGVDGKAAVPLLSYSRAETYRQFDHISAKDFLDTLNMPARARAHLFDVFAHSFFNHQEEMSAAEMIMQFHFYFLRNPEGLDFDAPIQDYETAIWAPLAGQLQALGGEIRTQAAVDRIDPGWTVVLRGGAELTADHVVLATDPRSAREIVAASPGLAARAPRLAEQMATVRTAAPYAVSRIWTAQDCAPERSVFTSVAGEPTLDSVTLYHRIEQATTQWARRTGGSVIELHAYAAPDGVDAAELTKRMWAELGALWPETTGMTILDVDERVGDDAPAFAPGSDATRPGVLSDADGVYLAGDWVRVPFPAGLMERAAGSAILAVNAILGRHGVRAAPLLSVVPRGLLAPRSRRLRR
ncbi:FAD-dependent oxidoreductase [Actinoplanes sp. LDG1-06]|uniref:FAD-dependent oxidoreductase n=1 Tax=Paractinoplanes ovalisporus TaxID=2810368 RepID=A0ABS2AJC6_9ACTN|nr:FAD-dependent oxidoreductase [Actinoplanes ovalisporus]MBM2619326.1 FAD-dependent oxidoreductase [Actinoplanes ovalisporus]